MKAALINGSPKVNVDGSDSSVSYEMLQIAKRYLRRRHVHNMEEFHIKTGILGEKEMQRLMECDVWLFSFPVYSSGVPSHLLSVLMEIEKYNDPYLCDRERRAFRGNGSQVRIGSH